MSALTLAVCAWPVGRPGAVAEFAAKLDRFAAEARAGGAAMLLCPEYAAMELGALAAGGPDARAELAVVVDRAGEIVAAAAEIARRRGLWLCPGSLPMAAAGRVVNRAPLVSPAGVVRFQEKRVMTRFEAEAWGVSPGAEPAVFATPWGRVGIAICYDCEFPALVRAQVAAGAFLVLVPACTDSMAGFNRVRLSARARALENQCFVAVSPTVGAAPWLASLDENRGRACVFGPVDRGFPEDGVLAQGAPDRAGLVFATLEPERLAAVRAEGAVRNHRDWPEAPAGAPVVAFA